jgi:hypothetical protein
MFIYAPIADQLTSESNSLYYFRKETPSECGAPWVEADCRSKR